MKKFIEVAFAILVGVVVFSAVGLFNWYQYEIYKKKHGDQMSYTDFLFDSERGGK